MSKSGSSTEKYFTEDLASERAAKKQQFTLRIQGNLGRDSDGTFTDRLAVAAADHIGALPKALLSAPPAKESSDLPFYRLEDLVVGADKAGNLGALRVLHWKPNMDTPIHSHENPGQAVLKCQFASVGKTAVETTYDHRNSDGTVTSKESRILASGVFHRDTSVDTAETAPYIHSFHTGALGATTVNVYAAEAGKAPAGKEFLDNAPTRTESAVARLLERYTAARATSQSR